jgi:hypothetical protein
MEVRRRPALRSTRVLKLTGLLQEKARLGSVTATKEV